jgi:hypothetical protein
MLLRRNLVEVAFSLCAHENAQTASAACEALSQMFERCQDALLLRVQPHIISLSSLPLATDVSRPHSALITSVLSAYVLSCSDSIARSGSSEIVEQLFAAASAFQLRDGNADSMAHAAEAIAAVGRSLQQAVDEDEGDPSSCVQGMMHIYIHGLVGLIPLLQVSLHAALIATL